MNNEDPLSVEEQLQLITLLGRMKWPVLPDVFHALIHNTVSVALELLVFDAEGRELVEYRKDTEYDGYALPGTVLRNNEDISVALQRLKDVELKSAITDLVSLGWKEILQGTSDDQDPHRHYIPLLYACRLDGQYKGGGEFVPWDHLPETMVSHEKAIVEEVVKRLMESNQHLHYLGK